MPMNNQTIKEVDGRWVCEGCGREWSALSGDNEIPKTCDCQTTTYVIYGGMDCDCVKYVDRTTFKSRAEFLDWKQHYQDHEAEGPFWAHQVSKAEFDDLYPESRDLALEAYEDGHPHIVYV